MNVDETGTRKYSQKCGWEVDGLSFLICRSGVGQWRQDDRTNENIRLSQNSQMHWSTKFGAPATGEVFKSCCIAALFSPVRNVLNYIGV